MFKQTRRGRKPCLGGRLDQSDVDWCGLIPLTCQGQVWVNFPLRPPKGDKFLAAFAADPVCHELLNQLLGSTGVF